VLLPAGLLGANIASGLFKPAILTGLPLLYGCYGGLAAAVRVTIAVPMIVLVHLVAVTITQALIQVAAGPPPA